MQLTHLSLTNFRNFRRLELDLPPGPTLLHGDNAQGKTNLLEAIYYLATTRSPHADQDQQLLHWEAVQPEESMVVSRLVAQIATGQGQKQIEMRLIREQRGQPAFRREALVNRRKTRLMDLLGNLRVVLFVPQDVELVTGAPATRRRYLDITICQTDPAYCRALTDYNKTLEQRNALLRRIAEFGSGLDLLPVYTDRLASTGATIFARRAAYIFALAREAQRIHYEELTDGGETLRLTYLPRLGEDVPAATAENGEAESPLGEWLHDHHDEAVISQRFQESLAQSEAADIGSGMTRVGPHRDDWRFWVSGRNLGSFGSRGQQRSAILALKLAEIRWMAAETGETPILLLDEVVAELDERRRGLLLETVQSARQAILTATEPSMFTAAFLERATTMTVSGGRVGLDNQAPIAM
jgi:DNA replication and repair protein RecF